MTLTHRGDKHGVDMTYMTLHSPATHNAHGVCMHAHTHVETPAGAGTGLTCLALLVLFLQADVEMEDCFNGVEGVGVLGGWLQAS